MTLTEFLLARIAEDERAWSGGLGLATRSDFARLSSHMLADCEAKRRIVGRYADTSYIEPTPSNAYDLALFHIMCDLASAYADHPGYRDEWRL